MTSIFLVPLQSTLSSYKAVPTEIPIRLRSVNSRQGSAQGRLSAHGRFAKRIPHLARNDRLVIVDQLTPSAKNAKEQCSRLLRCEIGDWQRGEHGIVHLSLAA